MSLNETPRGNRLHIGIFGKRNSGKSSIVNALTGHNVSLVSNFAGTTTDPVYKSMELHPIGPVVFIDTAGLDDEGELGEMRISKSREAMQKTDIALLLFDETASEETSGASQVLAREMEWLKELEALKIPVICVINKTDETDKTSFREQVSKKTGYDPVLVSAQKSIGLDKLKDRISSLVPEEFKIQSILGGLAKAGDKVLLVMPQDIQAPKGRLILPQVQTIRELLDSKCVTICTTLDGLQGALDALSAPPNLIITDSQCFGAVKAQKPQISKLTSFSVLFAAYKGDIDEFVKGASAIDSLTQNSRVLIAEACTHAPLTEDIGRVKIPAALRKKFGDGLSIEMVSGTDFPADLSGYDLIIHCGACMFNRKYMMNRVLAAKAGGVPMTNYGICMAHLAGILAEIEY
ncbi:MAG: [FeFe] hydrogenase H-cluster maturation GTPase HydF [Anaerovoracaceae bacterium]